MSDYPKDGPLDGPVVRMGFGSIRRGTLSLVQRHCHVTPEQITVVAPDDANAAIPASLSRHKLLGNPGQPQRTHERLDEADIPHGIDELGVLLYQHARNTYWIGSRLSVEETCKLAPYMDGNGLHVTSAVLPGIAWAAEKHRRRNCRDRRDRPRPLSAGAVDRAGGPRVCRRPLHQLDAADQDARRCSRRSLTPIICGSSEMFSCTSRAGRR